MFFGWWSVLACSIIGLWGSAFYGAGISAFLIPLSTDLGLSRATASVAPSIARALNGLQSAITGPVTDRLGPKLLILCGVFMMGLGLMLTSFVHSVWAFCLTWGVLFGIGANGAMGLAVDKLITDWFVRKRGTALSIRATANGVAGIAIVPLIAWLTTTRGWRDTCFIGGLIVIGVCLPLAGFLIKRRGPEHYGWLPDGSERQMLERENVAFSYLRQAQDVSFTLRQALRTRAFWLLILAASGLDLIGPALSVHGIPLLIGMGTAPVKAAGILAIVPLCSIIGAFGIGFLADRTSTNHLRFLIAGILLTISAGIGLFHLKQNILMACVFFVIYGVCAGALGNIIILARSRYFGRSSFGAIHGTSMLLVPPFAPIAPILAGWTYDQWQSYLPAFAVFAVIVAAVGSVWLFAAIPDRSAPQPIQST